MLYYTYKIEGAERMKKIVKAISNHPLWLWRLTLLNHLGLIVYIYYKIPNDYSSAYTQKLSLILVVLLIIFSYVCNFIKFRYSELKLWIILLLSLVSWQAIFQQETNNTLLHFFDILNPINSFLLVYSSLSIILLGEKIGEELMNVSLALTIITTFSYFIYFPLFLFLSLFTTFFLTFVPLLLLLLYQKELKNVLAFQRRNIVILSVVLPVSYVVLYGNTVGSGVLNLVWYIEVLCILSFLHFKTIFTSLKKKIDELKLSYLKAFTRLFFLVGGLLVLSFIWFQLELKVSFLIFNIVLLIMAIVAEECVRLFHVSDMRNAKDYLEILFLKRNRMVNHLLSNEFVEQQFSEFLHNEILQSVMAIKNFNAYSQNEMFGNQINLVTEELVQRIRERMDYYQPMSEVDEPLAKKYQALIDRIEKRYKKESSVVVHFPPKFSLMTPYDKLVYRFVEELITNAVKYSQEGEISLEIEIKQDVIFIVSENKSNSTKEHSLGYGLKNIANKLSILGGKMNTLNENGIFRIVIVLPIDKELCYENFVD